MVTRPTLAWLLILMDYASSAWINKLFRPLAESREQRGKEQRSRPGTLSKLNSTLS